ncbi:MAG: hypothetical protein ACO3ZY_10765, partial [Phycisphaerales bacterium]
MLDPQRREGEVDEVRSAEAHARLDERHRDARAAVAEAVERTREPRRLPAQAGDRADVRDEVLADRDDDVTAKVNGTLPVRLGAFTGTLKGGLSARLKERGNTATLTFPGLPDTTLS